MTKNSPSTGWNPLVQQQIDAAFKPKPSPGVRAFDADWKAAGGPVIPAKPHVLDRTTAGEIIKAAFDNLTPPKRASKYNAKRTAYKSVQGFERVYDSAAEAKFAAELDMRIKGKMVSYWLPQVPIPLPGGVKMVVDFMVVSIHGVVTYRDVKGVVTQSFINKAKQAKAQFGIDVQIVGKSR